jgi:nicotinamide-nucleotide amidase
MGYQCGGPWRSPRVQGASASVSKSQASWIVAVGDELLSGHTSDTNSAWLARRLSQGAYPCSRIAVVPDRVGAIAAELRGAASADPERVFCCGGLGPTPDDRTMAGVAEMIGVELVVDEGVLAGIRDRVARRFREGRTDSPEPNPGNLKMALIPQGATVLRNPVGGAPPLAIPLPSDGAARWLFVLPGVPAELQAVFDEEIEPQYLAGVGGREYREMRFEGVPESSFFPALVELESAYPEVSFGSYPQTAGGVIIRASAADAQALEQAITVFRRLAPAPPIS